LEKREFVERILKRMTLEQKIGQCIVVGMSGTVITNDLREAITRYHCSGIRLSGFTRIFRYFSDEKAKGEEPKDAGYRPSMEKIAKGGLPPYYTPEQYAAMLNELRMLASKRSPAIPLHMIIDQEGDTSKDLSRGGIVQFPSNMGLAASRDPELTYRVARAIGKQIRASGINMIHSPVVDVNINPANPEIGRRAFSDNKEVVAEHALAMVRGFKEERVIAAAKHFPGRGDSAVDAHHACPVLEASAERIRDVELYPYRKLIEGGIDAIMIAHTLYPTLDDKISTVSKRIVTDLLRRELGFEGLITTDSMTMGALIDRYGVGEACARALQAGADTILMKAENRWRGEMFYTVEKWVREGRITEDELDEKVRRILSIKYDYGLFDDFGFVDAEDAAKPYREREIVELSRVAARKATILVKDELGAIPLDRKKKTLLINQLNTIKSPNDIYDHPALFSQLMESEWRELQTYEVDFGFNEDDERGVLEYVEKGDYELIICTSFYDRSKKPHRFVKELIKRGYPVLLITNTPYCIKETGGLIPEAKSILLSMNLTPEGLRTMKEVLFGRIEPEGSWPLENYNPFGL